MSEPNLSDWTSVASLQREEERRRSEQKSAGATPPEQECRNHDEKHLSGVTVASMQTRFLLIEQRLAMLEERELEREIRGKLGAARAQFQSGTHNGDAAYFGEAVSAIGRRGEDHSQTKSQPESTCAKVEKAESEKPIQAGLARRIAAAFNSFVVTAFLASSIGFVGAILTVPVEKATQFHALVNIAVNAISDAPHPK